MTSTTTFRRASAAAPSRAARRRCTARRRRGPRGRPGRGRRVGPGGQRDAPRQRRLPGRLDHAAPAGRRVDDARGRRRRRRDRRQHFDRATFDRIVVNARGGDDTVRMDDANGTFTDTEITTVSGGAGDDTLLGGGGAELFFGGPGKDAIDGNRGNDTGLMGSGHDVFTWDPGDGSDVIEGQGGYDTMDFNGPPVARTSTPRRTGRGCGSSATPGTSPWTPTAWRRSTSTRSRAWTPPR